MSRLSPVASSGHGFDPGIAVDVINIRNPHSAARMDPSR
jgi:hypothetical protein